jgi:hypothetical protein
MHSVVAGASEKRQTYLCLVVPFSTGFFHLSALEVSAPVLWETCA